MSDRVEVVARWRRGAWHVSSVTGGEVVLSTLERSWTVGGGDQPPELVIALPKEVQVHLDHARSCEADGRADAAIPSRRSAALLLRSKRMHETDIARCLDISASALLELLAF